MPIQLLSLQFHQNGDTATLPLLLNDGATPLTLPEWKAGDTDPSLSPVAWLQAAPAVVRSVSATFSRDDAGIASFDVMASAALGNPNLMGQIGVTTVAFPTGQDTVTVALPFSGSSFTAVALHTDSLAWQFRLSGGAWTPLVTTSHRVYVVLAAPGSPWSSSTQAQWVWSDVLEYACLWAAGAETVEAARGAMATAFFNLGKPPNQIFRYGHSGQYTSNTIFDCVHMLKSLSGAPDFGNVVECTDVSATVSTFANALGGTVWQARMGELFTTTPIETIGSAAFASIEFGFHEVAWGNEATAADPVWDGCLQVQAAPGVGMSALDLPFVGYKPQLALSGNCNPQNAGNPSNRKLGVVKVTGSSEITPFSRQIHARVLEACQQPAGNPAVFIWGFFPTNDLVPGWTIRNQNPVDGVSAMLPAYDTYWLPAGQANGPLMRIQFASFASQADAANYLLQVIQGVASPVFSIPVGDYGFATGDSQFVVFSRGNAVFRFTSAGLQPMDVTSFATQTDTLLLDTAKSNPGLTVGSGSRLEPLPFPLPTPPGEQQLWYRLLSSTGTVLAIDGTLSYQPNQPGKQLVTVCAHVSGQNYVVQDQPFLSGESIMAR